MWKACKRKQRLFTSFVNDAFVLMQRGRFFTDFARDAFLIQQDFTRQDFTRQCIYLLQGADMRKMQVNHYYDN